jgi:hypothetical protein
MIFNGTCGWQRLVTSSGAFSAVAIVLAVACSGAQAQQPTGQLVQSTAAPPPLSSPIEVLVTPYFWLPWISSTVRPGNTRIPSSSSVTDPGTLISHLTWVPFMGAAEVRDGPFGLALDYVHAPVKAGINTNGILFSGVTGGLTEDVGTAMFYYRPIALPEQYVDVGLGVRAWGFSGNIALGQGLLLPAVTLSNGMSWADPLIGARYHREFGDGFSATAAADVGGFGAGAHIDWQVVGTIDYAVNNWIELRGGLRSLNFSYGAPRANFSAGMFGPILGATFRF